VRIESGYHLIKASPLEFLVEIGVALFCKISIPSKIGLERLMKVLLDGAKGSSPKKMKAKGLEKN
jgi:hypothetical protein